MHFLLIGATGRTGQVVLTEALQRGHTATALVRNPSSVQPRSGLTLAKGSPMNTADVEAALTAAVGKHVDAVIVTLNAKKESAWSKVLTIPDLMERSITSIAAAMKRHNVRKLVSLAAFGVGDSAVNLPWYLKSLVEHSHMKAQFVDHDNGHKIVVGDDSIDWVFVRPIRLVEGDKAELKVYGDQGEGIGGLASISIGSVADFMVTAAENSTWNGRTPVISN